MSLIAIAVVAKSAYIMIVQKDYWLEVAAKQKKDNVPILPTRGNILSSNGELMASSLPEFKVYGLQDTQGIRERYCFCR